MYTYPSKAENAQQLSIQQVEEIVSVLKPIQQQLLKDVILYGSWGDGTGNMLFIRGNAVQAFEEWAKQ